MDTSAKVIPVVYGANVVAPNLIWYGVFTAYPEMPSSGGGGGESGSADSSVTYIYVPDSDKGDR